MGKRNIPTLLNMEEQIGGRINLENKGARFEKVQRRKKNKRISKEKKGG